MTILNIRIANFFRAKSIFGSKVCDANRLAKKYLEEYKASRSALDVRTQLIKQIDLICDLYLQATDEERARLRAAAAKSVDFLQILCAYEGWCAEEIKGKEDKIYLRRALAAASIEDNRIDFRDTYAALGMVYEACVNVDLQPMPEFVNVGHLSSALDRRGGGSTHEFLTDFEQSVFFRANVKPKLRTRSL